MAKVKKSEGAESIEELNEEVSKGYVYPEYDLWIVDKQDIDSDRDGNAKKAKLTAVRIERKAVKIEDSVAEHLNTQSHNNLRRYYKIGTVQNGDEETITII